MFYWCNEKEVGRYNLNPFDNSNVVDGVSPIFFRERHIYTHRKRKIGKKFFFLFDLYSMTTWQPPSFEETRYFLGEKREEKSLADWLQQQQCQLKFAGHIIWQNTRTLDFIVHKRRMCKYIHTSSTIVCN